MTTTDMAHCHRSLLNYNQFSATDFVLLLWFFDIVALVDFHVVNAKKNRF